MDEDTKPNYAFIDTHNIICGMENLGWRIDWLNFRKYLRKKYLIGKAFIFVGYISRYKEQYQYFTNCGFEVVFKDVYNKQANVDVELTMQIFIEINNFDRAIIVSGDGDFVSLIKYLKTQNKFEKVMATSLLETSRALRQTVSGEVMFLSEIRHLIEQK